LNHLHQLREGEPVSRKELCQAPFASRSCVLTTRAGACRTSRAAFAQPRTRPSSRSGLRCRAGGDATGFLDLANLVSGGGGSKTAYDGLASKIGACAAPSWSGAVSRLCCEWQPCRWFWCFACLPGCLTVAMGLSVRCRTQARRFMSTSTAGTCTCETSPYLARTPS